MANQKVKLKQEASWKRKRWLPIVAPELFNHALLGETMVVEPAEMVGKTINLSLMTLTGDLKKQSINVMFKVVGTHDNKAITEVVGYALSPSSIKRFVRRGRARIDTSFVCKTADDKAVRIKPFIVTAFDCSRSLASAIQKRTIECLVREVTKKEYKHVVRDLVEGRLQSRLYDALKKITPLKIASIRIFEIVDPKKVKVVEVTGGKQERVAQEEEAEEVASEEVAEEEQPAAVQPAEEAEERSESVEEASEEKQE